MASDQNGFVSRMKRAVAYGRSRLSAGTEADHASSYWASLTDYHLANDEGEHSLTRSRWLSDQVVPMIGAASLLEVGTNSGRNLVVIGSEHPEMKLKGIDVNAQAIKFAQDKQLNIDFAVADANQWTEPHDAWDAILTMSVLDHIPDDAAEVLAANIARSGRHVIAVELWDGDSGKRGVYKYSRDTRSLFERNGFSTLLWELSPGQYDTIKSPLWAYVGARD